MTRILVAYGSKCGGTADLSAMIGDALTEAGTEISVSPARDNPDLTCRRRRGAVRRPVAP